jgi:DNA-binding beta-propeller fold protein YncE
MGTASHAAGRHLRVLVTLVAGLVAATACTIPGEAHPVSPTEPALPPGADVRRIAVPDSPQSLILSPDGTRAYVGTYETVTALDTGTGAVIAEIPVYHYSGARGLAISADGGQVYVESAGDLGAIGVIDTSTFTLTASIDAGIGTGTEMVLSPNGRGLYASSAVGGTVSVINLGTGTIGQVTVDEYVSAGGLAMTPDGTRLFVTTSAGVVTIDTADGSVLGTAQVQDGTLGALAISPDGTRLYAAYRGIDRVAVYDLTGSLPVATTPIELDEPLGDDLEVSPDGTLLFAPASHMGGGTKLLVIDLVKGTLREAVDVGLAPATVDVDPTAGRAYMPVYLSDVVLEVELV